MNQTQAFRITRISESGQRVGATIFSPEGWREYLAWLGGAQGEVPEMTGYPAQVTSRKEAGGYTHSVSAPGSGTAPAGPGSASAAPAQGARRAAAPQPSRPLP